MTETTKNKAKQYIYIVQDKNRTMCQIGKTNDLESRLGEYNSNSEGNLYSYLFVCQVANMVVVEYDIKEEYNIYSVEQKKEVFFFNEYLFEVYVNFIKDHKFYIKKIFIEPTSSSEQTIKSVRKTESLEERGMTYREVMQKARNDDDDEFYTQYEDVEKELSMYPKSIWKNKVVYCNCDDPTNVSNPQVSAFASYFLLKFDELKLKKLICTHYDPKTNWSNKGSNAYIFDRNGYTETDFSEESSSVYTGSFDDPISLKILNEDADIVCTNPPFSRAIDYWRTVIQSGKQFIIISNVTNPITTAFIPYFKDKKVWAGYNEVDWFKGTDGKLKRAAGHWYTNIPIKNRPKYKNLKIIPLEKIPESFKQYDDSKTLLVANNYIPSDYKEPFAVSTRPILNGILEKGYKIIQEKTYAPYIDGKCKFARALIQKT
ncbi:MAG: GIY-YIG nuclease family protein [Bacteroidetes bacterium]|nr:GIY-YIG nuclease family protein [Bacteroidota bacterium]